MNTKTRQRQPGRTHSNSGTRRAARAKAPPAGPDTKALKDSFKLLKPKANSLVRRFYDELFKSHPDIAQLFEGVVMEEQYDKLIHALNLVVENAHKPEQLTPVLENLGRKHHHYGTQPRHFEAVRATLLSVMAETAGRHWTAKVKKAWESALDTVVATMQNSLSKELEMKPENTHAMDNAVKNAEEYTRMKTAVANAVNAMMMVDRNLEIIYANQASVDILTKHEQTLRELFPDFNVNNLVGSNIDMFHKNPAHQRRLLSNPANLPFSSNIQVGPLTFNINVTAQFDQNGQYIGNTLEWSDITETLKKDRAVAQLQSAIDGAETNIMLVDQDLTITYVNPATVDMLSRRERELRNIWPGFDARNLVGQSIDRFHRNPAHQRQLLADANQLPKKAEIKVADLEFEINATMIKGPNGEYLGNMVEWKDITEQKDAERQIENLIVNAIAGKLDERIDTSAYTGFMKKLGLNINDLLDAVVAPIKSTSEIMETVAKGNLTRKMDGSHEGQFAVLQSAINDTMDNLSGIVTQIRESSVNIASAAGEIAEGNQNLSQRTEEQASSLEETASSMEELTSTVKQNADNAKEAAQLANNARQQAETGGAVVNNAIGAMGEINQASKKISEIIGVIDEIAFQTNLLALNAAVEAARAGEQGRGFAVVATEVRNLAQRSAAAAKEIKGLISDSAEKVEEGSRLVNESGSTLEHIIQSVKKVSDIIAEIAAASQEQSSGLDQVNKAVMQMDEVTQQNAALVEQAAAASESLDEQAKGLDELMTFFELGRESAAKPPARSNKVKHIKTQAMQRKHTSGKPTGYEETEDDWEDF